MEFCELRNSPHLKPVIERANEEEFTTGDSAPKKEKWRSLHPEEIERIRDRLSPINRLY